MSFIVDLIIIAVILLFTFIGYKRGLVKIAFSLCTFVIALIISLVLFKPVSSLIINNTEIDEKIETTIIENILPDGVSASEEINLEDIELVSDLYEKFLETSTNTIEGLAETLSTKIIETVVFLGIYIIAKIVLRFVTILADLIAKLPILNTFNNLGGIIFGFLQGCLIVLVAFALISLFAPMIDTAMLDNIDNSIIGSFVYNNNIVVNLIAK